VLVRGLAKSLNPGVATDGLTVLDDRVGDAERNTSVVLLKILQADLQVKLTGTSNNVLTRLGDVRENTRVRLGKTLKTFDELRKILGVLDLNGTLHDRGDGELHNLEVVRGLAGGEGTRLEEELIDTNQAENVTSGHIVDGLGETSHHENGALDSLDEQIVLLSGNVVRTLDADLETRLDGTREDTSESVETALVGSRHHL